MQTAKKIEYKLSQNTLGINERQQEFLYVEKEQEIIELLKHNPTKVYYPVSTGDTAVKLQQMKMQRYYT